MNGKTSFFQKYRNEIIVGVLVFLFLLLRDIWDKN